ncbi:MAG: hypothetical protein ABWX73_03135 [Marmoricola sp.]
MGWIRHALTAVGMTALLALTGCGGTNAPKEVAATTEETSAAVAQGSGGDTNYPTQTSEACDVLTPAIAKSVLGSVGEASQPPPATSNDDVRVTSCVRANAAASLDSPRSVSLLMRVAKSVSGARGNESVFAAGSLPDGAMEVLGYGQAAFWNPAFGQLNILKNGNWYILTSGPIDPRRHTLAETRILADALVDQL